MAAAACCRSTFFGRGSLESPNDGHDTPLSTNGAAGAAGVGTFQAAFAGLTSPPLLLAAGAEPSPALSLDGDAAAAIAGAEASYAEVVFSLEDFDAFASVPLPPLLVLRGGASVGVGLAAAAGVGSLPAEEDLDTD